MNIKTKILIASTAMIFMAVVIILFSITVIVNRDIDLQTKTLIQDLGEQSLRRISSTSKVLQRLVYEHIQHSRRVTKTFALDETIRQGTHKGQWKAIFAHAEKVCQNSDIDFLVVFDTSGTAQVSWPSGIDARFPELHFQELPLFKNFKIYIEEEDLVDTPVYSLFDKWGGTVRKGYGYAGDASDIVLLNAAIISNDYFDEPVGFVLTGINSRNFSGTLSDFSEITGQASLLTDGEDTLVWAGLPGEKTDVQKSLESLWSERIQGSMENNPGPEITHSGEKYHIYRAPLKILSSHTISVSDSASSTRIISGEPASIIIQSCDKIRDKGIQSRKDIFKTVLFITALTLVFAFIVANFVGEKISRPIRTAADISNKIASGDLEHVLDESGSDETGTLSKAMNKMIGNLKKLRFENENQLKALDENRRRTEKILTAIQEGVILTDRETGIVIDINPAGLTMIKAGREDIIGKPYSHYVLLNKEEQYNDSFFDRNSNFMVYALSTMDDNQLPIIKKDIAIEIDRRDCILTTFIDITSLKNAQEEKSRLENQLQQSKKMEAIGLLAGGVAHDLNNVLSGIVSYPDLILMQLPEESALKDPVETIKSSGLKAAAIVQDLLTLARRGVVKNGLINLNDIITGYLNSPELNKLASFHPRVQINKDLKKNIFNITGSPLHLSKTLMNLISNAAEAMPDGGEITISTGNCYIDRTLKGFQDIEDGEYVFLKVSDTGTGVSEEDKLRLFEPFYTKKVMGRSGTGLGMAVVWGTVKDHKGYIDIQTDVGKGTAFTIYLPASREKFIEEKSDFSVKEYMGNGETILVVDDIKEQREIAENILSQLGYSVSTVSSGEDAIEYVRNNKIDLLVLDMIMDPGIDGLDTFRRVIEINPGQKAIIASGFSETERAEEAIRLGVGEFVRKPYTIEKIGMALRNVIKG